MIVTISYPRSGATLVKYMLSQARPPVHIEKLHGHDLINRSINTFDNGSKVCMVIRNYKECIMSHLTRDNDQYNKEKIIQAFIQYMKVLEVYDATVGLKMCLIYENLISNPISFVELLGDFFNVDVQHIVNNIDFYMEASKTNYTSLLGNTLTDGKTTVHFTPLTKTYDFDWDASMRFLNPELYDKYIWRYE